LRAVGLNQGKIDATFELRTAGMPAKLLLVSDRSSIVNSWDDVAFVTVSILDERGTVVPNAENLINFKVEGAGLVAAVDSADSSSHEPYQASRRQAFQGACLALIKANANRGKIKLTATSTNLPSASVELSVARASRP